MTTARPAPPTGLAHAFTAIPRWVGRLIWRPRAMPLAETETEHLIELEARTAPLRQLIALNPSWHPAICPRCRYSLTEICLDECAPTGHYRRFALRPELLVDRQDLRRRLRLDLGLQTLNGWQRLALAAIGYRLVIGEDVTGLTPAQQARVHSFALAVALEDMDPAGQP